MFIKEVGLGLVLLFGGDSDASRRAGDALLRDRIAEAVEEGGFASIAYHGWKKSPSSASTLEFEGVEIERGIARIQVNEASINPLTHALAFEAGSFSSHDDPRRWRFGAVELQKAGWFSRRVRLTAHALEAFGDVSVPAFCERADELVCALKGVHDAPISDFTMNFTPRDPETVVQVVWRRGDHCHALWAEDEHRPMSLDAWGRLALAGDEGIAWFGAVIACDPGLFEQADAIDALPLRHQSAVRTFSWNAIYTGNELLLDTLFSLVPESYAYLLE